MLPGGAGTRAEVVNLEYKHALTRIHTVLVHSLPENKELKITLQIAFLLSTCTCTHAYIYMYMEVTGSGWVASSFLSTFLLLKQGGCLTEPGYH